MKASVGDRLVQASSVVDGTVRDGRVVELRHADGSPPYVVRWSDTGEQSLVFPGPDVHVEHHGEGEGAAPSVRPDVATTWRVQVTVTHEGRETLAQATLVSDAEHVDAVGRSRRDPGDQPVAVIGEEVAVARALRHLADRLTDIAEDEIEARTGTPARVHG
ncbi:DUF1918 domain-containing protein [Actinotalea sp. Marseille-Q4924]|uniref:DUF1918 domain-containing protein n=1 Tax=Actinotalea sp. Marseille-Q4924 TaxID=2866571 RepID=UPI001CE3DF90|nr:DUF1918 domain-containing protein [Actinotalea sp. Marseille-Q4924]